MMHEHVASMTRNYPQVFVLISIDYACPTSGDDIASVYNPNACTTTQIFYIQSF